MLHVRESLERGKKSAALTPEVWWSVGTTLLTSFMDEMLVYDTLICISK